MMVADVIARLKAKVPDLGGRVEGAAALAALMKSGGVPQQALVAHVLTTGIQGGEAIPLTGIYRQATSRLISVVLTINTGHAQGGRAAEAMEPLIDAVIAGLVGWQPPDNFGQFVLRRAQLLSAAGGVFSYEITFAVEQEVRII